MNIKNKILKIILNIIGLITIFIFMVYMLRHSMSSILDAIFSTDRLTFIGVFLLGILFLIVEGYNISFMVNLFKADVRLFYGIKCYCYSAFYRVITLGTGSSIAEVVFYKKDNRLSTTDSIGVATLHMIFYKVSVILLAFIGIFLNYSYLKTFPLYFIFVLIGSFIVTVVITAGLIILTFSKKSQRLIIDFCSKISSSEKWGNHLDNINTHINSLRQGFTLFLHNKKMLFLIFVLNTLKLIFWYSIPIVILNEHYPNLSMTTLFFLTGISVLVGGAIPTPAGIGSFDVIYVLLLNPLIGTVEAVTTLLLYRFGTYVLPFLVGGIIAIRIKSKTIKNDIKKYTK